MCLGRVSDAVRSARPEVLEPEFVREAAGERVVQPSVCVDERAAGLIGQRWDARDDRRTNVRSASDTAVDDVIGNDGFNGMGACRCP